MADDQPVPRRWAKILLWLTVIASVATVGSFVIDIDDSRKNRESSAEDAGSTIPTEASASELTANGDERFIQPGQCATNIGTEETMVLKIADCKPGTQRVLARIEQHISSEAEADTLCAGKAPGYDDYHYSNWDQKSQFVDVVFCLRSFP